MPIPWSRHSCWISCAAAPSHQGRPRCPVFPRRKQEDLALRPGPCVRDRGRQAFHTILQLCCEAYRVHRILGSAALRFPSGVEGVCKPHLRVAAALDVKTEYSCLRMLRERRGPRFRPCAAQVGVSVSRVGRVPLRVPGERLDVQTAHRCIAFAKCR